MQTAPPLSDAWLPPRATSQASSYHTVLDHFTNAGAIDSTESLTSTIEPHAAASDVASSPPKSPELEYETITHRRHGKALIIEHPTLVNFIPSTEIQTTVSVTADRDVIDTIFPPTAVLRASQRINPTYSQGQKDQTGEFDVQQLLKKHEEELCQTLRDKLTENYDPTGSIKKEIFTTLTQVTRFPDPVGTDLKRFSKDQCPCVCSEVGCDPLQPHTDSSISNVSQPSSFLDMTEASTPNGGAYGSTRSAKDGKTKHRFGFLTLGGRFGRSRSSVDLSRDPTDNAGGKAALPVSAPPLSSALTEQATPPRSKSFSDLVRRRRSKHMARTSLDATPTATHHTHNNTNTNQLAPHPPSADLTSRRLARHSLDTTRTPTPTSAPTPPTPPPRRSSKVYAHLPRKPIPTFSSSSTIPRNSLSMYSIGQIVEEDEGSELVRGGLMSSYHPANNQLATTPRPVVPETQFGLAL